MLRGALDKLLAFAKAEPQAGIWGGRTLFADGSLNPSSCWRRLDLWALAMRASGLAGLFRDSPVFNAEAYGGWRRDSPREVDIVTGCLFLIRRETWDRLGGFDPSYVMYGDEADLCRRAQAIGLRPMITPAAEIVHYAGASETVRADKGVRLYRALMTLIHRHFPPWQRPLARALLLATPMTRALALRVLPASHSGARGGLARALGPPGRVARRLPGQVLTGRPGRLPRPREPRRGGGPRGTAGAGRPPSPARSGRGRGRPRAGAPRSASPGSAGPRRSAASRGCRARPARLAANGVAGVSTGRPALKACTIEPECR